MLHICQQLSLLFRSGAVVRLRSMRARLRPVRARLRPVRARLRPVRARLRPVRARLRPVRARLRPVRAALLAALSTSLRDSLCAPSAMPAPPSMRLPLMRSTVWVPRLWDPVLRTPVRLLSSAEGKRTRS
jgi:hypothetical protein